MDILVQYMPFIWIGFAVLMVVCEAFTSQLVSIWFVIGSVCAAVSSIFFKDNILIQSLVFLVVSLVALIVTRPLVARFKAKKQITSTNADRVIGKTGVLLSDISDVLSVGQVKVDGEIWSAKTENNNLKAGDKVRVLAIEGVKLIVKAENN